MFFMLQFVPIPYIVKMELRKKNMRTQISQRLCGNQDKCIFGEWTMASTVHFSVFGQISKWTIFGPQLSVFLAKALLSH